jgi:hypothetical protein
MAEMLRTIFNEMGFPVGFPVKLFLLSYGP